MCNHSLGASKWKDFKATDANDALHQLKQQFKLEFKAKSIVAEEPMEKKKELLKNQSICLCIYSLENYIALQYVFFQGLQRNEKNENHYSYTY